jgi:hypothetical protein
MQQQIQIKRPPLLLKQLKKLRLKSYSDLKFTFRFELKSFYDFQLLNLFFKNSNYNCIEIIKLYVFENNS